MSGNPNLSEIKRERKHLEQDAQMLANRIKLLQLEDEKTWRKIQETKKKAKQLALVRQEQDNKLAIFHEIKQERERAISEKRNNYRAMKEFQRKERDDLKSAIFRSKYEDAILVKHQRESNIRNKQTAIDIISEENRMRNNSVKREKLIGKRKIMEFQQQKNFIGREMYLKKIEENERIKNEKIKQLSEMEMLEMQLIKRLENTKSIHDHANRELQSVIGSAGNKQFRNIYK